jgi:hypothetical protein
MAVKIDGTIKTCSIFNGFLNGQSYEEWLNNQHQKYLNEQSEVIDRLLKKKIGTEKGTNE